MTSANTSIHYLRGDHIHIRVLFVDSISIINSNITNLGELDCVGEHILQNLAESQRVTFEVWRKSFANSAHDLDTRLERRLTIPNHSRNHVGDADNVWA